MEGMEGIRRAVMDRLVSDPVNAKIADTVIRVIVDAIIQGHKCSDLIEILEEMRRELYRQGIGERDVRTRALSWSIHAVRGVSRWIEQWITGSVDALTVAGAREAVVGLLGNLDDPLLVVTFINHFFGYNAMHMPQQEHAMLLFVEACETEVSFILDILGRIKTMLERYDRKEAEQIALVFYNRGYSRDQTVAVASTLCSDFCIEQSNEYQSLYRFLEGVSGWCGPRHYLWPPDLQAT